MPLSVGAELGPHLTQLRPNVKGHSSPYTFTLSIVLDGETAETAVNKVLADILLALDKGDIAMLTLLDLSAAFDTVDHLSLIHI